MRAVKVPHLVVAGLVGTSLLTGSSIALATTTAVHNAPAQPLKTAQLTEAGISLGYPATWIRYRLTKQGLAAQQRQLAKSNPGLALTPSEQAQALKAYKFVAIDPDPSSASYQSNINVLTFSGGFPSNLDEFTSVVSAEYQQRGATVSDTSTAAVDGETFYRVDLRSLVTPRGQARISQLAVPHDGGGTLVSVPTEDNPAGASLVDAVLRSVRPLS